MKLIPAVALYLPPLLIAVAYTCCGLSGKTRRNRRNGNGEAEKTQQTAKQVVHTIFKKIRESNQTRENNHRENEGRYR